MLENCRRGGRQSALGGSRHLIPLMYAIFALAHPASTSAQEPSVRDVLSFLVTNQAVPTADFVKDRQAAEATRDTIARALLVELATLPITTSSGGFTYRFNPSLGTIERLTQTFGTLLVDRAVTTGKGQALVGITYRHATFTSLDGRDLRNGTLVTTANRFRDEATAFDVEALTLRIQTTTMTLLGNYGVTNWLDVGGAVPVVRLNLSGQRVNTYRGASLVQARGTGVASGLADIALRAKVQIVSAGISGLATGVEVRLPTGDPDDLRGAGRAGVKASVIGSFGRGPLETHLNAAVTAGGISQEIGVGSALAVAATSRLTFSAEAIVRRIEALSRIRDVVERHPLIAGVNTIRLLPAGASTTTVVAVAGVRWNPAGTWLVNAHLLVPVTDRGLSATPVPSVSLDYSFAR